MRTLLADSTVDNVIVRLWLNIINRRGEELHDVRQKRG